jgi:peptide/nickel transport system substrate-binding protein
VRPSKFARHVLRPLALLSVVALVVAACGSSKKTGGGTATGGGKKGGSPVFLAEQWPECLNPITSCNNAAWLPWVAMQYVMPRLMELDTKGNFIASDLLVEAPSLQNGDITMNPFTIKYKLRPEAVWDDGSPITSSDIQYTWQAIMKTTGTTSTTGYDQITSIDTSDPHTAVMHFKAPFADWWDLFGGFSVNGVVLKKAAFNGTVNVKDVMKDSYPFSGGPWKLKSFSKQQSVLVPNTRYWVKDKIPHFDQVTFVPREDQATEINGLLTGEGLAIYPQPSPGVSKRLNRSGISTAKGAGSTYEGLWMNEGVFPFTDAKVRQAFAYAVDRQAVIDSLYKSDFPELQVLNCAGWVPNVGSWCDNSVFADLTYQPAKAKQILQSDGWTIGGDGIATKGGKRLTVQYSTTAGNKTREDTQALLKDKAKAAGFDLVIKNFPPTQLFEDKLPKRDFVLAEFAQVASPDPSVTAILSCDQIPSAANGYSGQNFFGWCNKQATALIKQINKLERQDLPWIPMFQKPLILAWHSDRLTGPIGSYAASSYSGFFNMNAWSMK